MNHFFQHTIHLLILSLYPLQSKYNHAFLKVIKHHD